MTVPSAVTSYIYPYIWTWYFLLKQNYNQRRVGNGVMT